MKNKSNTSFSAIDLLLFHKDTIANIIINFISYPMVIIALINFIVYFNRTCVGNTTDNNYCHLTVVNRKNICVNRNPLDINIVLRDFITYSNFFLFIISLIYAFFFILSIEDGENDKKTIAIKIQIILIVATTLWTLFFITSCYSKPTDCRVTAVKDRENNILVSCKPTNTDSGNLIFILLNMSCLISPFVIYFL